MLTWVKRVARMRPTLTHAAVALQRQRGADDDRGVAAGELHGADRDAPASPGS